MPTTGAPAYLAISASLASGGTESLGWLNDLLAEMWPSTAIAAEKIIRDTVEPMFAELLPGPLKTLKFTKLDLGDAPFTFSNVDVHSRRAGFLRLNLDMAWDGDADIELKADHVPALGVRKVTLKGRLSVVLGPLVDRLPVVAAAKVAFINPPALDLDFTGLADVADWSIVDEAVRKIIDDVLKGMLVLPQQMLVKLDAETSIAEAHQEPLGVCRLTPVRAGEFKVQNKKSYLRVKDVPDVYLQISLGAHPLWRTKTVKNTTTPEFNESRDFLLSDHDQLVTIVAWDDDVTDDDYLGTGTVTVGQLLSSPDRTVEVALNRVQKDGGDHFVDGCAVVLRCDVFPLVSDATSLAQGRNLAGLLTVLVANAYDVPGAREDAASCVTVAFGTRDFCTAVVYDMPGVMDGTNPVFDAPFLVPLGAEDKESVMDTPLVLALVNGKEEIGRVVLEYSQLLEAPDLTIERKVEVGQGASIKFSVSLRGVSY